MSLPAIVPNLISLARQAAGADSAGLWLLTADRDALKNVFSDGLPDGYVGCVKQTPLGKMTCGRAAVDLKPHVCSDMLVDPDFKGVDCSPIRACFSVPVIGISGDIHGTLACHFKETRSPSPYDIERNVIFAQLIAFALDESKSGHEEAPGS